MTQLETARPDLSGWTVGVIGLGLMGLPMARNLLAAGARVLVHNRSPGPVDALVADGAVRTAGPEDMAARTDLVILMLTDTPAVEAVAGALIGAATIGGAGAGLTIVDMGTTAVAATRALATRLEAKGGHWVDAPVSGGQLGAREGSLSIMTGAAESDFTRLLPLFQVLGQRTTHVGAVGAGQVAKAANQVIVGLTIGAVSEALALAKAAGVDPAKVRDALMGGFATSRILDLHGQRMVDGAFIPGGRATVQRKDLQQALDLAGQVGIDLPATALSRDLYDRMIALGWGDLDHSGLFKIYDQGNSDPE
ncbi:MAG: NAD(P)-dependent oxidoreductase [Rhodospirillum sp.]|nr:NAD(P)-dependent oxidoreductase [Rhodospirillum sp.]MCF8489141.1 NAD(P)-dependent oxidoreductase [Rhodospirillum sp.]MCF8502392.1 NAD(P)-dependent oxidoreductase [Rhodospirillum sp.]